MDEKRTKTGLRLVGEHKHERVEPAADGQPEAVYYEVSRGAEVDAGDENPDPLFATLADAAGAWDRASRESPERWDLLAGARVLHALHFALGAGDGLLDGQLLKDLQNVARARLRAVGLDVQPEERPEQLERLARRLGELVERNKERGAPTGTDESDRRALTRGMAELFLCDLDGDGRPMAGQLAEGGIVLATVRPGTSRRDLIPEVIENVQSAFAGVLRGAQPRGVDLGETLVKRGLKAIGFKGDGFAAKIKRELREIPGTPENA